MNPRITISLPCYERPERTLRAIKSIIDQTTNGYELLITGDHCPNFESAYFKAKMAEFIPFAESCGNTIILTNNRLHCGYWGTEIRNEHIRAAKGRWLMFMGSDDVLLPKHLENVLKFVEGTDLDFAYFDTYVEPLKCARNTQLKHGMIGHQEIVCNTQVLKKMPPHKPYYGHDWELVHNLMLHSLEKKNYKKPVNYPQTYIVKSIKGKQEIGID